MPKLDPRNICMSCAFCIFSPDPIRQKKGEKYRPTRLDFRCGAVAHDKGIDPVTGDECYYTHESGWVTDEKHPPCIDMNPEGECQLWSPK